MRQQCMCSVQFSSVLLCIIFWWVCERERVQGLACFPKRLKMNDFHLFFLQRMGPLHIHYPHFSFYFTYNRDDLKDLWYEDDDDEFSSHWIHFKNWFLCYAFYSRIISMPQQFTTSITPCKNREEWTRWKYSWKSMLIFSNKKIPFDLKVYAYTVRKVVVVIFFSSCLFAKNKPLPEVACCFSIYF